MNSLTVYALSVIISIELVHGDESAAQLVISNPSTAIAYGGTDYVFTCNLPNANEHLGETDYHEILWLYKGPNDSMASPMVGTGDVFNSENKRIIDGEIANTKDYVNSPNKITTTLTIKSVDEAAAGEYNCVIRWHKIYLSSTPVLLKVRSISSPPDTTNVAKGADAKFTCVTTGDSAATITFHKAANDEAVSTVAVNSATANSIVTTTGILTISTVTTDEEYYCKAAWTGGDSTGEVKSGNVYLSVMDLSGTTTTVWGVPGKVSEFQCTSGVLLKASKDTPTMRNGKTVYAATTTTWEIYDSGDSTWKASSTNNRLTAKSSTTSNEGVRAMPLLIGDIQTTDADLKVRCKVTYQSDTDKNVVGGTVTSGELVLKIASITSFTASNTGPIVGGEVILTCVATGGSAPTFSFTTGGKNTFDNTFLSTPEIQGDVVTDGTTYTVKYKTTALKPNVLRDGSLVDCRADYGKGQKFEKQLTVTNYYDCSKTEVKTFNPASISATITKDPADGSVKEDGSLTQTISCPADSANAKYSLKTEENSAASITCTKNTGKYDPPYLARCAEYKPLTTGSGRQTLILNANWPQPCSDAENAKANSQYSTTNMKAKLISTTDTVCGFRHRVKCLSEDKCKLDETKSGCSYDPTNRKLTNEYHVIFDPPVWSVAEKDAGVAFLDENALVKFWGCSGTYND